VKDTTQADIVHAIQVVAEGGLRLGTALAERVRTYFAALAPSGDHLLFPDPIARGFSNARIAEPLVISPRTIRNHIKTIFDKLQTPARAEAIIRAREAGFGNPSG
jgi:DNA-binding NarL/FixJ family response regulator